MDFLEDLFPYGFILVEQFAHAGIGIEGFRSNVLQEQIAEGRFAGSDPPCYSENGHTKQMVEPSAGIRPNYDASKGGSATRAVSVSSLTSEKVYFPKLGLSKVGGGSS